MHKDLFLGISKLITKGKEVKDNLARKIEKKEYKVENKIVDALNEVVNGAKEFVVGCRHDLELFTFLNAFDRVKFSKKSFLVRLNNFYATFIRLFPVYWGKFLKQTMDYCIAFIALIVFSPIMLIIAFMIKLTSPGPIFYKQERVGKGGKFFMIYKFRSMRVGAEDGSGPVWAKENDNRLTYIGGFLRKSHLDELPQLFNVLKGDMSLIGPRPERPYFVGKLKRQIPMYLDRLDVKPGITGLAQVRNRYDETLLDVKRKVKYDLLYIKKMCLFLDLKVMFWTVGTMLTGKGAR